MNVFVAALALAAVIAGGNRTCAAAGADYVGIVKTLAGDVVVERNSSDIKAEQDMKLMRGDLIRTGASGKVGLIFEDDTVVSLGSNSRMAVENYQFHPAEKKLSFIVRFFRGTASFLSGQIAKLSPAAARVETPHATVGMRGTHFLVKVDD